MFVLLKVRGNNTHVLCSENTAQAKRQGRRMRQPLLPPDGRALEDGTKEKGKQGKFALRSWGLVAACVFLGEYVFRLC